MKKTKDSLLVHGIINVTVHIPAMIIASFWGLLIMYIFNFPDETTFFWIAVELFPFFLPPVSCVIGIVRGIVYLKKERYAVHCLILSIVGMFIYAALFYLVCFLGSIY